MKRIVVILTIVVSTLTGSTFFTSCSTVPITGRQQFNMIPESQLVAMSMTSYDQFLNENQISDDRQKTDLVKRVGNKIALAVAAYLEQNGLSSRIEGYDWEFNLVDDDIPNAWCMPGGKVVVYTGILPYTKTETGLAVVMGHEIAHAIARHGNERMSQAMLIETGGLALAAAIDSKPEETKGLFMMAYGVGTSVGLSLPYSRAHETEADKLGLIFMAMAGYNPQEAVDFWGRMAQSGGQKPPEFLSTHPSDQTRIADLRAFMPEALKYYKQ
ncbi:MAG: M48 family metallopeptidase [Bacteroidales bacterium]|nr:M48 family metallopeptidase [Bacteroidales bacterium]